MSVGTIRANIEIRLECDVEDEDAKKYITLLEELMPSFNILNIESVKIDDNTEYDGVPIKALYDADANGQ